VADEKLKFLVVDDSNISRKWFINAIPKSFMKSVDIVEANDGFEALDHYSEVKPDIVFLDITMPKKDGFETLQEIMDIDESATVVMVSADRQKSTKERVLKMGAKAVLNKPIDDEELREVLMGLMK
jgi:two-component system chemotaxis response regulator CheY